MVRMGEFASSAVAGHVLVSLGLGSCIGLALLDKRAAVAGLAHVVLPAAEGRGGSPGKFADTAVEALIADLLGLGDSTLVAASRPMPLSRQQAFVDRGG